MAASNYGAGWEMKALKRVRVRELNAKRYDFGLFGDEVVLVVAGIATESTRLAVSTGITIEGKRSIET